TTDNQPLLFRTNNPERIRITASGAVGIGTNNPTSTLTVGGSGIYKAASTFAVWGVRYDWKQSEFPDYNFPEGKQIGFIAQEVEKVLPELVNTDANGYKSVAYANVAPVLVEAVKTQQKQMDALKKDNDATKKENTELKAQLATI